jgi:hypothetical protein
MAAINIRAKLLAIPLALAFNVTVFPELTDETVAVNPMLAAFAGTVRTLGRAGWRGGQSFGD